MIECFENRELLYACPHCGGKGVMYIDENAEVSSYFVECHICHARGGCDKTESFAANRWNLRKDEHND